MHVMLSFSYGRSLLVFWDIEVIVTFCCSGGGQGGRSIKWYLDGDMHRGHETG